MTRKCLDKIDEIAKLSVVSRKELLSHRRLAIRIFWRFN